MGKRLIAFLIFLLSPFYSFSQVSECILVRVLDGDTIVCNINGKDEHVRLYGIDAPESQRNTKLKKDMEKLGIKDEAKLLREGKRAKEKLQLLLSFCDRIIVEEQGRDKYGSRIVGLIKCEFDIGKRLLKEGYVCKRWDRKNLYKEIDNTKWFCADSLPSIQLYQK